MENGAASRVDAAHMSNLDRGNGQAVQKNEQYVVIRWLEKCEEVVGSYMLSNNKECIVAHRAGGLITVKTLGKIQKIPSLNTPSEVKYKLHSRNAKKIMATASRK